MGIMIVEINGIKMDIDERTAKATNVESYKVGDRVRLLVKCYSEHKVAQGVIVGFDNFRDLPTISVLYISPEYGRELKIATINAETQDVQLVPALPEDAEIESSYILDKLDAEIRDAHAKIADLELKKRVFIAQFGKFFPAV